ncbi:MAG TPA: carboxypeptidase regulatory-like domain-containing protein [Acidobacteriaceae bacterium]|jgi:hypothetical protein
MTIRKLRSSVFIAIVAFLFAVASRAQSGQADVQGIVKDATGSVVAGADVALTNTDSGAKRTVKTASDGRYAFPTVAPGHYAIMVMATGFSSQTVTGLTIELDQHVNQDVALKVGSIGEVVEVTGSVPQVDTTGNDVGGLVTQAEIDDLPIQNRQYLALALLTPGTTQAGSRSFYSNVQSGGGTYFYANGFSWDGVSNQQTEEGDPRQNIPEDAVGEFKTYTAMMPADLGWAMGGFTALVTKSGGNRIHGDAFEYNRNTAMAAPNQFQTGGVPTYNRNQYGGSVGGPIFKNRTHYFGAYERTQAIQNWTLAEPPGSLAATYYAPLLGTFTNPSHDQLIVGRVDHDLTSKQQIFFRVAFEQQLATAQGCNGTTTNGCYDGQFPRKAYVAGHTWEPTAHMVNEARFQYAYISYELGPWNTPPPKRPEDFLNPSYAANITVGYTFPSFNFGHTYAADGVESRWQLNDTLSIQRGAHSFKIGGDVSYVPYTDAVASTLNGNYTFNKDQPFDGTAASIAKLDPATVQSFSQNAVPLLYYLPSTQQAYFVEDSWKIRPTLTLNFGLRYDLQRGSAFLNTYTPNPAKPVIPFEGDPHKRGDWNNLGPRVGFAWDPFGKSKDVIRGGYGIFYNFIETELTEAEKLNFVACAITLTSTSNSIVPFPNPYGGQSVGSFCSSTSNTGVTILSPGLSNPYLNQFSLGYSRQLSTSLSISVDGLYDRGLRDYKIYDLNRPANYVGLSIPRPNTQMAQIQQHASTGASEYRGLFVKLDKRMSHKYMYTVSYALSSATDNNPHGAPVNYNNLQQDWGQASIDQRNAFVTSAAYEIPFIKVQVGGIFSYRSRTPFSLTTTQITADASLTTGQPNDGYGVLPYNPNYNGTAQYVPGTTRTQGNRGVNWDAVNAYRAQLNDHAPAAGFKATSYYTACHPTTSAAPVCLLTNLNANSVTTNRYKDFDLRVSKTVFHHESMKLDIIGQAFNLFGTENYTTITTSPISYTFGAPTAANTAQIGELAAKFTF